MSKQVLQALGSAFAALAEHLNAAAEAADDAPPEAAAAPARAAKPGKGASAAAPAPRAAVAGGKGKGKGKAAPAVDFDTLKGKLMDNILKGLEGGKDIAIACLDRFGAQKLSELQESQYDEFNTYLDQVIAGEVDPMASEQAEEDDALL